MTIGPYICCAIWGKKQDNWIGAKTERLKVAQHLHSLSLKTKNQSQKSRDITDSDLHFDSHIKSVTKSAYYHLKDVARPRVLMSTQNLQKRIRAFITSKLKKRSLRKKTLRQLQLVQNAAGLLTKTKTFEHIHQFLIRYIGSLNVRELIFKSCGTPINTYMV